MRFCRGDVVEAALVSVAIYEKHGPATGDTPADRLARLDDHARLCEYWASTYNDRLAGTGTGSAFKVSDADVAWMQEHLPRQIGRFRLRLANETHRRGRVDMDVLAVVLVVLQQAIHDKHGERGAVDRGLLLGAVQQYLGRSIHTATVAAAITALIAGDLIQVTREAGPGRCRMFQLTRECPLLPAIAALPASEQCVAPRRPVATPPPPPSPTMFVPCASVLPSTRRSLTP